MNALKDFHLYKINEEFYNITNWKNHKVRIKNGRPNLILILENQKYPDSVLCIPISKDDNKQKKYKKVMRKHPNNVHPLTFNQYDNYALIQNSFFLRKEFVDAPFTVNGIHVEIVDKNVQRIINQKFNALYAIYKHNGPLPIQVNYDVVYNIQDEYIQNRN